MKWKEQIRQFAVPRWKRCWTKALAWTLVLALLAPSRDIGFAYNGAPPEDGICVHHPQHTAECGYAEAGEGAPCTHEHDEACGYSEPAEGTPCTHKHDEACGYAEASEEIPCDMGCTETDETGAIVHNSVCAYAPAEEGAPCTHEHSEACGYREAAEGTLCTHEHDEVCGFAEAVEGAPCGYVCALCVVGWQWDDDGLLVWNEDAKLWGLGIPGTSAESIVTRELLSELLPGTVTAMTAAGEQTVELVWDLSAFPEEGAYEGSWTLTAALSGEYVLTEAAPALEVLLELGGGETYAGSPKYVNQWSFILPDGTKLSENKISITVADLTDRTSILNQLRNSLPPQIRCWGFSGWDLSAAGFT